MSSATMADVLWDSDEGVAVLGPNVEIKTHDPMEVVNYLVSLGVPVGYTDHDSGDVRVFDPAVPQ